MDPSTVNHLAAIGFGYTAKALARRLHPQHWRITGTSRSDEAAVAIRTGSQAEALVLNDTTSPETIAVALADVTHLLISAAPTPEGDPVIERLSHIGKDLRCLNWIGYLSTVGVYGDHDGDWVDEDTPVRPLSKRAKMRVEAENSWRTFEDKFGIPVHIFRLPGIYGPGRSVFDRLQAGTARRIVKPGQVFNRMHVDDIAGAIEKALTSTSFKGPLLNLTDDLPAPPQDVISYAAQLMDIKPPREVMFYDADMTIMTRSFYGENKRVSNQRMKSQLSYELQYPTYREGLQAIWNAR